ncbi:hypothetical protein RQP50_16695 [Paenibacillus sp. chi10]|uniref:PepSY domain-containing protein n=1 Tax=Paenibacillus suaedae TaxID=3077233 RepID=A0AAJ2JVF8_9BACL|nr:MULTISPECIES: hypothetical protein [unclassified Paenibacillus]MDT8977875.1 hypothetical protein [Paenibacillus sp. chi10]GAV12817.1 hypothetical protein PBN151_2750 [Paenibacillus sp. NAIST15-1]
MNIKKAIVASMIVSSMLVAVAGPIPAGAEAAQEQKQTDNKKVQIDQRLAAKLQKAIKVYAGKEIKLKNVGEKIELAPHAAKVESVDGKYAVRFSVGSGGIWQVDEKVTIDKISKEDQEKVLKVLKGAYANKTYVFDKEVIMQRDYDGKNEKLGVGLSYQLTGKDFEVYYFKENAPKMPKNEVSAFTIKFTKEELDPKLLETAIGAIKTVFNHDLEVTSANLSRFTWTLEDKDVSLEMEEGKVVNVYHKTRKAVTTNTKITENDAKEVVAPLAKELFNMDIADLEVKWDSTFKNYYFIKDKQPVLRVALDADKNVAFLTSGIRAFSGW